MARDAYDLVLGKQLPEPDVRRTIRKAAGLTHQEIANHLGVTRQAVSYWEAGKNNPTGDTRRAYAALLKDLSELTGVPLV